MVTNKKRIKRHGVYINTPVVNTEYATVAIETSLENRGELKFKGVLETLIIDGEGKIVAKRNERFVKKSTDVVISAELKVDNPKLWSPDSPYLYKVVSRLKIKNKIIDEVETNLGVRIISWKAASGFLLNGKVTKLLGVSEH